MIIVFKRHELKLPDFLIVGAAKSGTTSLYYYLMQHPQIFMSEVKEPHFFTFMGNRPQPTDSDSRKTVIWRLEDYFRLFEKAKYDQVMGEASTSYLYKYYKVIRHIRSVYRDKYKNLKIITILRNPIDRAFSNYLFHVRKGMETLPFKETVEPQIIENRVTAEYWRYDYIGPGMYYKQVKAYMEEFPQIKIYLFEDLNNPREIIKGLFEFLCVDPNIEIATNMKANPSGIPKSKFLADLLTKKGAFKECIKFFLPQKYRLRLVHFREELLRKMLEKPEIDASAVVKLINIYRDDILELQKLTNRDLSHWLEVKA